MLMSAALEELILHGRSSTFHHVVEHRAVRRWALWRAEFEELSRRGQREEGRKARMCVCECIYIKIAHNAQSGPVLLLLILLILPLQLILGYNTRKGPIFPRGRHQ